MIPRPPPSRADELEAELANLEASLDRVRRLGDRLEAVAGSAPALRAELSRRLGRIGEIRRELERAAL